MTITYMALNIIIIHPKSAVSKNILLQLKELRDDIMGYPEHEY